MSYILDALKKVEHDKNNKCRPDGRVNIIGELFHDRKQPIAGAGVWKIVMLVVLASLVTCAGTWFALRGENRKNSVNGRPGTSFPVQVSSPPLAPVVLPPPAPVPLKTAVEPASAPPRRAVPVEPEATAREERPLTKYVSSQSSSRTLKQSINMVQPPVDIKLSGIAWQDERGARRAVINGFLLKEGAVVSGATITDIQSDRVRFSSGTGMFEIKLDSVLPAEVKK